MNAFIQQGLIKFIKRDSKDIILQNILFQINAVHLMFILIKESSKTLKNISVYKNMKQHNCFQHWW